MFVVDKAVEEGRRLLLASGLGSVTLSDGTTRLLGPAARDASPSSKTYAFWETASVRSTCSSNISTSRFP